MGVRTSGVPYPYGPSLDGNDPLLSLSVEIHVLSAPMCVYYSYKLYGSVLPYDRSFARAHQDLETYSKRVAYRHELEQQQNTIHHSRTNTINIIINCPLIKYNVIIPSHPFSSS